SRHKNIHTPAEKKIIFSPYIQQDLLSAQHFIGVLAQERQQFRFTLCQRGRLFITGQFKLFGHKRETSESKRVGGLVDKQLISPEEYIDPRKKLFHAERFDNIIICPHCKPL